jgi:hypothetical protein
VFRCASTALPAALAATAGLLTRRAHPKEFFLALVPFPEKAIR